MDHFLTRLQRWWLNRRAPPPRPPILLVVEGVNDIHFLQNVSAILSNGDPSLPDLRQWEVEGRCLFLPTGGDVASWTLRLAALHLPQIHVYDRETGSVTDSRRAHVVLVNLRPNSRAFLTSKRALENFLHASAVHDGLALDIAIDDEMPVAEFTARAILERASPDRCWESLPMRSRKRRRDRAKRLLNTIAVRHMTIERLAERDPQGELTGWLRAIEELAGTAQTQLR